jgi:hypothetical protein
VPSDQTFARTLHDLGAAAWFGGALMGAVGLQGAAAALPDDVERVRVADLGWQQWQPWKTAAIATHVLGSVSLLWGNKGRLAGQRGAMTTNIAKTGVFVAALGADLYAVSLGRRVAQYQSAPEGQAQSATDEQAALEASGAGPGADAAEELDDTHRRLRAVQWAVPALTGLNIALAAKMGEQQRPANLISGFLERLDPRA